MSAAVWATVVGAFVAALFGGGLVGAILVYRRGTKSDLVDDLAARLALVESRQAELEAKYSRLWAFCRQLIDYAYRWRRPESPDLPDMPKELT